MVSAPPSGLGGLELVDDLLGDGDLGLGAGEDELVAVGLVEDDQPFAGGEVGLALDAVVVKLADLRESVLDRPCLSATTFMRRSGWVPSDWSSGRRHRVPSGCR